MNPESCVVLLLSGDMDVSGFDCGDTDLNDFLQTDALKNQKEWFSVTKVLFLDDTLAGYFTIVADTLHKGRVAEPDAVSGYPYQKYPAVKLARLAVDVMRRLSFGLAPDSRLAMARPSQTWDGFFSPSDTLTA